jgi:integrase/recombinase XerD
MGRRSQTKIRNDRERQVVRVWRASGVSTGSINTYLQWVRRFQVYCQQQDLDEIPELTLLGAVKFANAYRGPRRGRGVSVSTREAARAGLHAWASALRSLGMPILPWKPSQPPRRLSRLLDSYRRYRQEHRGVSAATLRRDIDTARDFLSVLRSRGRRVATTRVVDIDAFVTTLSARLCKRTVADTCSSLRAFLRFLHASGRIHRDLAFSVVAPRVRLVDRPPRALAWNDVRRILKVIPRQRSIGKRDYSMLQMMATYGFGAAEVLGLCLEDIDWNHGVLQARRPKTSLSVELPLLPAIANALSDYLRFARPPHAITRRIFVGVAMPHSPLTSGAIRHRIREYARLAGIEVKMLGAHILRHSHASRQVDNGANSKVVSDVLGHRSPSSTSVYVRVALSRLRRVSLPVPL